MARLLLDAGANANARALDNKSSTITVLHLAVWEGHVDIARMLLDAGADAITPRNAVASGDLRSNITALHTAVWAKNLEAIQMLLDAGADVNVKETTRENGEPTLRTPLHSAAQGGDVEVAYLLVNAGADIDAKALVPGFGKGTRPLHLAARAGHLDVVKLLLGAGAEPDPMNDRGYTPSRLATELAKQIDDRKYPYHRGRTSSHSRHEIVALLRGRGTD